MLTMPSVDDVVEAFQEIEKSWERYRATLRAALAEGEAEGIAGRQAKIAKRLDRTREMLRRDAMTDEQRAELRAVEAERKRAATAAKGEKVAKPEE